VAAEAEADAQEEAAWLAEERMRREEVSAAAATSTVITAATLSLSAARPSQGVGRGAKRRWVKKALGEKGVG
jgi:hypothetical protein